MTGRIGPKVSSCISFMSCVTSTTTVGSKKRPGPWARLPPTSTFAPLSTASFMWSSMMSICGSNVTAPISTAPASPGTPWARGPGLPRYALAQGPRLLDDLAHELVVDRLLDIHALDRLADLPTVGHRPEDGAVGRALEVCVFEDDHRVLAAELERVRRQRLRRLHRDELAGLDAAREHHVVDV